MSINKEKKNPAFLHLIYVCVCVCVVNGVIIETFYLLVIFLNHYFFYYVPRA